jgi:hypothetical protein
MVIHVIYHHNKVNTHKLLKKESNSSHKLPHKECRPRERIWGQIKATYIYEMSLELEGHKK